MWNRFESKNSVNSSGNGKNKRDNGKINLDNAERISETTVETKFNDWGSNSGEPQNSSELFNVTWGYEYITNNESACR